MQYVVYTSGSTEFCALWGDIEGAGPVLEDVLTMGLSLTLQFELLKTSMLHCNSMVQIQPNLTAV